MKVKPHTSLKHRTIGYYFSICRSVMKGKNRTMYYVDLFAGDGSCECSSAPKPIWEPPYFRLLEEALNNNLNLKCFFNDKNQDRADKLEERLQPYKNRIIGVFNRDANIICSEVLNQIPPEEWSIFVLDPFKHTQLNFSTIELIAKHEAYDKISGCIRKPEMIITFMTYSMLQYLKVIGRKNVSLDKKEKLLSSIDRSLGTNKWRDKILDRDIDNPREDKTHNIFLKIFLNQLSKLGYDSVYFHINQILNNGPIYFLIFATSIPRAYEIVSKKFEPYVKKLHKDVWIKENFRFYKMAKAREQGIRLLDDFK